MLKKILTDIYNPTFKDLNILECGAHHPEKLITEDFISDNNCWYLEPNPKDFENLKKSGLKNCFEYALSNFDGTTKFTSTSHPGNSSINHSDLHKEELEKYNSNFVEIEVECITYSSLMEKINCKFDILCIDIEGHEITVLNSIKNLSYDLFPKIIVIECGYDWNDRLSLLESMGYEIDTYWENNCILSILEDCDKNKSKIQYYNTIYTEFVWNGILVYKNNLSMV